METTSCTLTSVFGAQKGCLPGQLQLGICLLVAIQCCVCWVYSLKIFSHRLIVGKLRALLGDLLVQTQQVVSSRHTFLHMNHFTGHANRNIYWQSVRFLRKNAGGRLDAPFIHLFICWSYRMATLMLCCHFIAPGTCKGDISASAVCHP